MLKKVSLLIMLLLLLIPACTQKQDLVEKAFDGKNFDRVLPPTEQDKPNDKKEEKEEDEKTKIEVLVDNIEEPRQDTVFTKTGLPDRVKPNIFKNDPEAPLLNFEDAKLYDVIYSLCELLGVNFIIDPSVKDQTVTINMVRSDKKLLTSDLFDLLLKLHDLTIVQHESFISIVPIASPDVNPGLELLHGTRANQNLRNEEVVMQIVPLRYVAPADINAVIKEFMSTSARIYEEPKNNVLILVDKYQHIAKAMELIPIFDVDLLANKKLVFYELAHVDATEVAAKLKEILGAYGFEEDGERLSIVPIESLNGILIVTGTSSIFKEIDFWVKKFDKEGQYEEEQVFIYKVENTTAFAISATISQIYDLRTGSSGGGFGGGGAAGSRRSTSAFGGNSGLNSGNRGGLSNNRGGLNNSRGNVNTNNRNNTNNRSGVNNNSRNNNNNNNRGSLNNNRNNNRNNFVNGGRTFGGGNNNMNGNGPLMIVDEDNNSLIFQTTQREYSRIFKTLRKLDVLPRQVFLEVTVLSVSLSDTFRFGLNWNFNPSQRADGNSSSVLPVAFNSAVPNADGSSSGFATGGLGGAYSYVGATGTLLANVEALKQNGYANLLQQPHIMAIDNQSASISVGTDVPIQTSTTNISNIATGGSTTPAVSSNIQYRSTGVNLSFTPHINANGVIRLEIALDISDPGEVSAGGSAPPISQNSLQTEMIVRDNQTVVMGGLILDQESWSKDSVPLIGRLPILKHLFTDRNSNMKKSELIVMITPRLVDSEEKSIAISKEFKEKILKEFEGFKKQGF